MQVDRTNFTDVALKLSRNVTSAEDRLDFVNLCAYVARLEQALDRANAWKHYTQTTFTTPNEYARMVDEQIERGK